MGSIHTGGLGDTAFPAAFHQGGAVSVSTLFLYDRIAHAVFVKVHIHADLPAYVRRKNTPSLYGTLRPPFEHPNSKNTLKLFSFCFLQP
jgi:hypothetical protein